MIDKRNRATNISAFSAFVCTMFSVAAFFVAPSLLPYVLAVSIMSGVAAIGSTSSAINNHYAAKRLFAPIKKQDTVEIKKQDTVEITTEKEIAVKQNAIRVVADKFIENNPNINKYINSSKTTQQLIQQPKQDEKGVQSRGGV